MIFFKKHNYFKNNIHSHKYTVPKYNDNSIQTISVRITVKILFNDFFR